MKLPVFAASLISLALAAQGVHACEQSNVTSTTAPVVSTSTVSTVTTSNTININTANLQTLVSIRGVGPTKAQAIIEYRNEHGDFRTVSDLMNVRGIGPAFIETNRSRLRVN